MIFSTTGREVTNGQPRQRRDTGYMTDRQSGVVKWFSAQKGFGFILRDGADDVFVHFSEIMTDGFRSLRQGQYVEYSLEDGEKGPHAKQVKIL